MPKQVEEDCRLDGKHDEKKPGFVFDGPLVTNAIGIDLHEVTGRDGIGGCTAVEKRLGVWDLGAQIVVFDAQQAWSLSNKPARVNLWMGTGTREGKGRNLPVPLLLKEFLKSQ